MPISKGMLPQAVGRSISRPAVLLGAAAALTVAASGAALFATGAGQAYGLPSVLYVPVVLAALARGQRAALVAAPIVTAAYVGALWAHGTPPIALASTGTIRLGVSLLIGVLIGSAVDQTRQLALAAQREAAIDPLTGLGNRRALDGAWRRQGHRPAGVVMLDMDGLKALNDREGHAAGDHAIRTLATAIEHAVRPTDTVARVGGDEFVILAETSTLEELRAVADRITQEAHHAGVEASVGFALIPADGADLASAIAAADARMYHLKAERASRRSAGEADERPAARLRSVG